MRLELLIAFLSSLILILGGCAASPGGNANTSPSPSPSVAAAPTPGAAAPASPGPGQTPAAAQPTPATEKPPLLSAASELIQPTNPVERSKQAAKGRQDPFGLIDLKPVIKASATSTNQGPQLPKLPDLKIDKLPSLSGSKSTDIEISQLPPLPFPSLDGKNPSKVAQQPGIGIPKLPELPLPPVTAKNGTKSPETAQQPGRGIPKLPELPLPAGKSSPNKGQEVAQKPGKGIPKSPESPLPVGSKGQQNGKSPKVVKAPEIPQQPGIGIPKLPELPLPPPSPIASGSDGKTKELPPIPQPNIARAIEVSGVVTVGKETQIIVKIPSESSSRYVRTGQRLAGGQVLVKRIDNKLGSEPVIILEENGIEVPKSVGEKAIIPDKTNSPAQPSPGASPNRGSSVTQV